MSENPDGWTPHDGKGMPVDGDTLVTVRFQDDAESDDPKPAKTVLENWKNSTMSVGTNIVAYRIHQPSPSKESAS